MTRLATVNQGLRQGSIAAGGYARAGTVVGVASPTALRGVSRFEWAAQAGCLSGGAVAAPRLPWSSSAGSSAAADAESDFKTAA